MIKRYVTLKLQGNRAVVDSPIYVYRHDTNLHLEITLVNNKFDVNDDMLVSYTVNTPKGDAIDSAKGFMSNGKINLVFAGEYFDEETELGANLVQIKLYTKDRHSNMSIPPFVIHVLASTRPIYSADEDDGLISEKDQQLLDANEQALAMGTTVKITELPVTTSLNGVVPMVANDGETYQFDMSSVATMAYVEDALTNGTGASYATKEYVDENVYNAFTTLNNKFPSYVSEEELKAYGYAPITYVDFFIENIDFYLGAYALAQEVESTYATKTELNGKANTNHAHEQYATHDDVADALANITSDDIDLSDMATKEDLVHNHDNTYAKKSHIHSYNDLTNLPTIPSIEGLASEDYVDNAVANVTIDTSSLATKEDLTTKADKDHNHDSDYYTIGEIDNQLSNKADARHYHEGVYYYTTEVDSKLATKADKTDLDAKANADHVHSQYVDLTFVNTKLASKADADHTHDEFVTNETLWTNLAHYSTTDHNHDNTYAKVDHNHDADYYGINEVDNFLATKASTDHNHDGVYASADHHHDSDYYTIGEMDNKLANKADTNHTHDGMVIAGTVMRVMFVDELPAQQEENVIYFVAKASE